MHPYTFDYPLSLPFYSYTLSKGVANSLSSTRRSRVRGKG